MDDPNLDPIDETAKPDLSDSELSDVDEEAYAGIDTNRIGLDSDDEGPNVFALKPAKLKTGTGERRKRRDGGNEEERRRIRQERRLQKEPKRRISDSVPEDRSDQPDPNARPEDPEAARRWDLDHAMDAAIARKPVKRRKKDDDEFVCSL
jgi:transcription factor SPN1